MAAFAPIAFTCVPRREPAHFSTGSAEPVAVTTMSAPSTALSTDAAARTGAPPSSLAICAQNASSLARSRAATDSSLSMPIAFSASTWVRACLPVPISATLPAPGFAIFSVATALAAPVRIAPSALASMIASRPLSSA